MPAMKALQFELTQSLKGIHSSAQGNALGLKSFWNPENPEGVL
jgi:hypothetical protein